METIYNVEWDEKTVMVTLGDTIDIALSCTKNGVAEDLTGMQIDMPIKYCTGDVLETLSTSGGSPKIVISTTSFTFSPSIFTAGGIYTANVKVTDGGDISTFMKITFIVEN